MMNNFTELEYKYKACDVGLKDFTDLMEKISYDSTLSVSSWDYYYVSDQNPDHFMRFRSGISPELTIKRKTKSTNSWVRKEIDLPLDAERINKKTVEEFVKLENYTENFKIFKNCFIYFSENINYVYYVVYDEQMRVKDTFIEVEVNKGRINQLIKDDIDPMDVLKQGEKALEELNIFSKNRLKKSLFEMFYRSTDE